jgi:hypothetical protein
MYMPSDPANIRVRGLARIVAVAISRPGVIAILVAILVLIAILVLVRISGLGLRVARGSALLLEPEPQPEQSKQNEPTQYNGSKKIAECLHDPIPDATNKYIAIGIGIPG